MSAQVELTFPGDFVNRDEFAPSERQAAALTTTLDQPVAWSTALAPLRAGAAV
ncbi:hypothetical protein [Umezawaea sp. Da 62-37]|uniref:hypothetical protein n=1 Tax=Umezawaea sp. Da 62-37 TaxID=3075927 RepID=UPI0028F71FF9|nr:hypothetical protein [Umezawaea sp. Da 62-37]WNV86409.1 hypothetical protein RM788_51255 [Umezawaea sp. Da 62-37]